MKRAFALFSLALFCLAFTTRIQPGSAKTGEAEILRDEFGVPHIFAPTLEAAAYAVGYAQAEDRLEELLKNYRKAEGTMSEAFGPDQFQHDYLQRRWRHAEIAREKYGEVSPKMRACIEAFQEGIKQFMKEHPEQVPKWAPELHPWQVVALARYVIWGWPLGEAGDDLKRGGIEPDPVAYRGSNEMLLSAKRTAFKAPIAVIDPHLSWYGEFRFYEVRIYAGDFAVSGVSILGIPFPSLGHNRWASVAMTTGGPDTSDIFEEEINPTQPRQYKYEGQWREMTVRKEQIKIRNGEEIKTQEVELEYTPHGPIVARKDGKAYAMAIPYFNEVGLIDQIYQMYQARNLDQMKKALSSLQLMAQNVMVGTIQGDIFYVRNGRVPIRGSGCNPNKPMPGKTAACDWKGIHPFKDLVQIANPPQGYMQNNNCSPFAMMKDSPLRAEKYTAAPYLYNDENRPPHQRAATTLEELDAAQNVTLEQMIKIVFSTRIHHADQWQARLKSAWEQAAANARTEENAQVYELIQKWDRRSDPDSAGALAYYAFKISLPTPLMQRAVDVPTDLTDAQLVETLGKAATWLKTNPGSIGLPFGRFFRVGREGGKTYPVGGGSLQQAGMATPRAISFRRVAQEMVGHGGQTSTQLVVLTDPPQSFTILPLGESDHRESGHWDDQAEKLFSKGQMKPTYFLNRPELLKHVTFKKTLSVPAPAKR
ncbi:MAG TPA: penicillin acylase family protein [Blastocatellia bacterium]|nr:penicillin acylase family protein [Blastocatellia bacterium]